ncbi:MAG TPA: SpoIIE family protein phosphatase [Blastocatellia bacterium]|jgi:serine phosphatase RsbU (regulator of sigma subunit)/predicted enzyme related to lactoylglutathione lyase
MSDSPSSRLSARSIPRLDCQDLYLRIHHVTVFVRDQDRSLRFYLDQLGFSLVGEASFEGQGRWVAVSPPDGSAIFALVTPKPDSEEYNLIGQSREVGFITEDVNALYEEWRKRGVHFQHPPQKPIWGGLFTTFEDVDGNSFSLVGWDETTREIEAQRSTAVEKLESERRAAQEMEIAKQVQARLFPQTQPPLRTLDYAGMCIQARQVGGDYYDFLNLGQERLGLVIGDISGKGIAAALMMANLQANMRSQCAIAVDRPHRFLKSVNQLFYENTTDSAYATLFFAEYDDRERRLRYANCGHLSALLLRSDGALERLDSTSTVLGLFNKWDCPIGESRLFPGDTLALYTDGVTESFNDEGEEFGEERLVEALRRYRELPPQALLVSVLDEVRRFSPHEQSDDITLVVAKGREDL